MCRKLCAVISLLVLILPFIGSNYIPGLRTVANSGQIIRVTAKCLLDRLELVIYTSDSFTGTIYPFGQYENSSCYETYEDVETNLTYSVPFLDCNTILTEANDGSAVYQNTIVVLPHGTLITTASRMYTLRCNCREQYFAHFSGFEVRKINDTRPKELITHFQSATFMKAYALNETRDGLKVGNLVHLDVSIPQNDVFGIQVSNCFAKCGSSYNLQVQLIDENGCAVAPEIFGNFNYSLDSTRASVSFASHRFPESNIIYYHCQISVCVRTEKNCKLPICTDDNAASRRVKRSEDKDLVKSFGKNTFALQTALIFPDEEKESLGNMTVSCFTKQHMTPFILIPVIPMIIVVFVIVLFVYRKGFKQTKKDTTQNQDRVIPRPAPMPTVIRTIQGRTNYGFQNQFDVIQQCLRKMTTSLNLLI